MAKKRDKSGLPKIMIESKGGRTEVPDLSNTHQFLPSDLKSNISILVSLINLCLNEIEKNYGELLNANHLRLPDLATTLEMMLEHKLTDNDRRAVNHCQQGLKQPLIELLEKIKEVQETNDQLSTKITDLMQINHHKEDKLIETIFNALRGLIQEIQNQQQAAQDLSETLDNNIEICQRAANSIKVKFTDIAKALGIKCDDGYVSDLLITELTLALDEAIFEMNQFFEDSSVPLEKARLIDLNKTLLDFFTHNDNFKKSSEQLSVLRNQSRAEHIELEKTLKNCQAQISSVVSVFSWAGIDLTTFSEFKELDNYRFGNLKTLRLSSCDFSQVLPDLNDLENKFIEFSELIDKLNGKVPAVIKHPPKPTPAKVAPPKETIQPEPAAKKEPDPEPKLQEKNKPGKYYSGYPVTEKQTLKFSEEEIDSLLIAIYTFFHLAKETKPGEKGIKGPRGKGPDKVIKILFYLGIKEATASNRSTLIYKITRQLKDYIFKRQNGRLSLYDINPEMLGYGKNLLDEFIGRYPDFEAQILKANQVISEIGRKNHPPKK